MFYMANIAYRRKRKNNTGSYDTVYYETDSRIVIRPNGESVENELTKYLPSVQSNDESPSLTKGQIRVGRGKMWAMGDTLLELPKRNTLKVVIGTTTNNHTLDMCDVLCDGTNDLNVIAPYVLDQGYNAYNYLELHFLPGTYNLTKDGINSLTITKSNVMLIGHSSYIDGNLEISSYRTAPKNISIVGFTLNSGYNIKVSIDEVLSIENLNIANNILLGGNISINTNGKSSKNICICNNTINSDKVAIMTSIYGYDAMTSQPTLGLQDLTIMNNKIKNLGTTEYYAIQVYGMDDMSGGSGLVLYPYSLENVNIARNTIDGFGGAITIGTLKQCHIANNHAVNVTNGIVYDVVCRDVFVENNYIELLENQQYDSTGISLPTYGVNNPTGHVISGNIIHKVEEFKTRTFKSISIEKGFNCVCVTNNIVDIDIENNETTNIVTNNIV